MMEKEYVGEHLLWGNVGHAAVAVSFVFSMLSAIGFFLSVNEKRNDRMGWFKTAMLSYRIHSVAVLGIIAILFHIIYYHYFEYFYAWKHSSRELPVKYMISCFWEGQEGSFLLWIFWQVVLGTMLMMRVSKWTAPVMACIALCQAVLGSMLLGIDIFGIHLGSTPFELLRDSSAMANAPIFSQPDYLAKVYERDGNGLNPLLQNYWMVIHPPTLFLGFASTIIPFAFCIAGLWTKNYSQWIKPALPWTLFSVGILGTGIMMGGMWAYESLSFGGYWAWDPVENASLIPWLVLVSGMHTMLIYKSVGHSLRSTFIFLTGTFLLVLYSTFLTRSGILGNSSVHSFTDLGLSGQLLIFLFLFIIATSYLIIKNWKKIPSTSSQQNLSGREFWMFIGAVVLILSAIQITFTTSFPVINKIFGTSLAPPADAVQHYNTIQLPLAIVIAIVSAIGQFFSFKKTADKNLLYKNLLIPFFISAILCGIFSFTMEIYNAGYIIFLLASLYTLIANILYLIKILKWRLKFSGASIAHIGFGMMLIGIIFSSVKKNVLSINHSGEQFFDSKDEKSKQANFENILLLKNKTVQMGAYAVTYMGDSVALPYHFYKVDYIKRNKDSSIAESFRLYPDMLENPKMGNVYNPDTRHYLYKDIFTHVSAIPDKDANKTEWHNEENISMKPNDTAILANNAMMILTGIESDKNVENISDKSVNVLLKANFKIITLDSVFYAIPLYALENNQPLSKSVEVKGAGIKISFKGIKPQDKKPIQIEVSYKNEGPDFIIMKAIEFPLINLLWAGTVIMVIGTVIAVVRRLGEFVKAKLAS